MIVLELFSGTKSVGKICNALGWEVTSLDLKDADININVLEWDYKQFQPKHFDIIWASPPCNTFSKLRTSHLGRPLKKYNNRIFTRKMLEDDIINEGLPILNKTLEIIDYFKPKFYFIENPQTGRMKDFINLPFYDVDYCRYSNYGYQKRTRIWTNLKGFNPKLCDNNCGNIVKGRKHKIRGSHLSIKYKYRIPSKLIEELFILTI